MQQLTLKDSTTLPEDWMIEIGVEAYPSPNTTAFIIVEISSVCSLYFLWEGFLASGDKYCPFFSPLPCWWVRDDPLGLWTDLFSSSPQHNYFSAYTHILQRTQVIAESSAHPCLRTSSSVWMTKRPFTMTDSFCSRSNMLFSILETVSSLK